MDELFPNISEQTRRQVKFIVDMAIRQDSPQDAVHIIKNYVDACYTEEEKDFVDFYFNMRMEQLLNEQ